MPEPTVAPLASNNPPLVETAKMEIDEKLKAFEPRQKELLESFAKASCVSADDAGKCTDLAKQLVKLEKAITAVRVEVKAPYSEAVSAIDGAPKRLINPVNDAIAKLRRMLSDFDAKVRREEQEKLRAAENARRLEEVRLAAERAKVVVTGADVPEPEPEPEQEKPKAAAPRPVASGDYGSAAHRRVTMVPEIVDVYALPPEVLEAPDVTDAILKTVRRMRQANANLVIPGIKLVEQHGLMLR